MDPYQPMRTYPHETWLTHLVEGNVVFLVKEDTFAEVEWPYSPPNPQHICGRIGLRFRDGRRDSWLIRPNGRGINGTQCLMPVLGHLPDDPPELPREDVRHILQRLDRLEERVLGFRRGPIQTVDVEAVVLEEERT